MIRLVRAEFLKVRTTQTWFWLLLAAMAVSALFVIGPFAAGDVRTGSDLAQVFSAASTAYIVVFVLGALGVTGEIRHQTITATVLATPSRWAVVTGKMITYAVLGVAYALACLIVQLAIAVPWAAADGMSVRWGQDDIPRALGGVFLVLALFGIVGLGIGALLRNQMVAVPVGIIFLLVLQGIIAVIPKVKVVYPYLPGGAVDSILPIRTGRGFDVHLLPFAGGVIVLLLWAFVPAVLGAAVTLNRDIT
ncbi:MAG: hypothetical protein EPN43_08375 [Jatrophihabitans sp.]|nr:MAG: hypothetical protein EPN43_08375 [Jatrophihabitans sp.]